MYYALIDYDGEGWQVMGLDEFEHQDSQVGGDGPALDALKRRAFHRIQELNDGNTIIVKWVYTNVAHKRFRALLNAHVKAPDEKAAKLLADAGVTEGDAGESGDRSA